MGIQINGQTDTVTAIDGSLNVGGDVTIPGVLTYDDVTNVDSIGVITARSGIYLDRFIYHSGDLNTSFGFPNDATDTFTVNTSSVERLRITGDGNIGIGTDDPTGTNALTDNTSTLAVGIATVGALHVNGNAYPSAGALSNRNLVINGAMRLAQRGTSSTTSGYGTCDRWRVAWGQGAVTQTQESLTTGAPYDEGFRYFVRAQNTTTSTATNSYREINTNLEGQDIATSGWDYTSNTSYITLSYWVRSSVAQDYEAVIQTRDGTNRAYSFPFTLAADTWTKITETIPGSATNQIDNDNGVGLTVQIIAYYGTDYTSSSNADRTWRDRTASDDYTPVMTSTWANTTNATFDLTGVQLEVGSVATPFEHRNYGDELTRCQRYYLRYNNDDGAMGLNFPGYYNTTSTIYYAIQFPVNLRDVNITLSYSDLTHFDIEPWDYAITSLTLDKKNSNFATLTGGSTNRTQGDVAFLTLDVTAGWIAFESEL